MAERSDSAPGHPGSNHQASSLESGDVSPAAGGGAPADSGGGSPADSGDPASDRRATPDSASRPLGPEGSISVEEVYFPADVAQFLAELSRAVQKHAIYPPAHPALRPAISGARSALQPLLETRAQLTLGVGRRRIAVADAETDPQNPLFRGLAEQLHDQELASVTFRTGLSEDELADFLAQVSLDPRRSGRSLGRSIALEGRSWRHILLQPVRYEGLGLAWSRSGRSTEQQKQRADELWLTLASSLLPDLLGPAPGGGEAAEEGTGEKGVAAVEGAGDADEEGEAAKRAPPARRDAAQAAAQRDPEQLAAALEAASREEGYARQAFQGLATVSREMRAVGGEAGKGLQRRTSRFVSAVEPEALQRVLATASDRERHDLIRDAARWMDPTAVVKLVRTTGAIERRDLSNPLVLLMAKMARYANSEAPDLAPEAEANLRDQVERLLEDWDREYDVPEPYREALKGMAFAEPEAAEAPREPIVGVEPEHVLRVGLLVDKAGPHVWNSATALMQGRRFQELVDALDIAPAKSVAAEELWEELATPKAVAWILTPHPEEEGPDVEVLDRFVGRLGPRAAPPLLDRMANTESPELRKTLFARLETLGPSIAPDLLERLRDGRWWVRRNALTLLRRVGGWPATWSPHELSRDRHPEVRAEALALLLRFRDRRDWAICELLAEASPRARTSGLEAAQEEAPPEAVPLLLDILHDESAETENRVLALRALSALRPPELPGPLIDVVATPRGGLFRLLGPFRPVKLEPKSRVTLETLAVLSRHWKKQPEVMAVLRKARKSRDEPVKAAAYGKLIGESGPPTGESGPPPGPSAARRPAPPSDHVPGPEDSR